MDTTALPGWDHPAAATSAPTAVPGPLRSPSAPAHLLDGLDTFPGSLSLLSSLGLPLPVTVLCMLSPVPRAARWASASSVGLYLLLARATFQPRSARAVLEGWTFCKAKVSPCLPIGAGWGGQREKASSHAWAGGNSGLPMTTGGHIVPPSITGTSSWIYQAPSHGGRKSSSFPVGAMALVTGVGG